MKVEVVKKERHKPQQRNAKENYEKARILAIQIPPLNHVVFEMLVDLSISDGLTCGECCGFQCSPHSCHRGIIVAYAVMNKPFFEWLHRHTTREGVSHILSGITQVGEMG